MTVRKNTQTLSSHRIGHSFAAGDWREVLAQFRDLPEEKICRYDLVATTFAALQVGDTKAAKSLLAKSAGFEGESIGARIVLASLLTSLGRCRVVNNEKEKAEHHFDYCVGLLDDLRLFNESPLTKNRFIYNQLRQSGYLIQARQHSSWDNHSSTRDTDPVFRMIHHFACTGGTMISKCIASMNNTAIVSEIHPDQFGGVHFNPVDPLQVLLASEQVALSREDLRLLFWERLEGAIDGCNQVGKACVLRDHAHSDYCLGGREEITQGAVRSALPEGNLILSLVTVRHPLDSYASMVQHGWHQGMGSFDEFCYRYLIFLDDYRDAPVIKYERFCEAPEAVMQEICGVLDIDYNPSFLEAFANVKLTGDSGRGRSMSTIEPLPEKRHPEWLLQEAQGSHNYRQLQAVLNY